MLLMIGEQRDLGATVEPGQRRSDPARFVESPEGSENNVGLVE